ncbi:MAG: hypothetical protein IJ607_11635 [Bacteroidaceae bacterium]|nr:hypothetical protein [Bacteroidaceae bacterium]
MNRLTFTLQLSFTPMTKQQICICCHAVRGCKCCCRTCIGCSSKHECEHEVNPEGMDSVWWNAIVETFSFKHVTDSLPDGLRKLFKQQKKQ